MKFTKKLAALATCTVMTICSATALSVSAEQLILDADSIITMDIKSEIASVRATSTKTIDITVKRQQYKKWCWAACTEAFTKKYFSNTYTRTSIANSLGFTSNDFATLSEVKDFLNTTKSNEEGLSFVRSYFKITNTDNESIDSNYISFNTIKKILDEDKPIILRCTKHAKYQTVSHMVVCYGYKSSNSPQKYELLIYDPDSSTDNAKSVIANTTLSSAFQFTDPSTLYVYDVEAILYKS